jgi:hypothetical protein
MRGSCKALHFKHGQGRSRSQGKQGMQGKQGTQGSVTIYFIIVTAAFVLLTGLLIDFARIAAFRKQAELAVKSGVRSTLSSYDPIIYARYGLFIRGGETANQLFRETLEGNAAPPGEGALPFLDTRWEDADITESRPLASHDVFRRQILEEMKYKAPIDLTLEMGARFRGVSGAMKEATATVNLLERIRKAYDQREMALDEVLNNQSRYGESIHQLLLAEVPYPSANLNTSASAGEVRHIADVTVQYEDYVRKRQEDEARQEAKRRYEERKRKLQEEKTDSSTFDIENELGEEPEGPRYAVITSQYERGTASLSVNLNTKSAAIRSKSEEGREQANASWYTAKAANDEMRAILVQAQSTAPTSTVEETTQSDTVIGTDNIQSLEQLRKTAEELILTDRFFEEYEAEIGLQYSQGLQLANEATIFASLASSVPGSTGRGPNLQSSATRLQDSYSEYIQAYEPEGVICSARASGLQAHRSHDNERKQEEQKAKVEWSGVTHFLGSLTGTSGTSEEQAVFSKVNELYKANKEWNSATEEPFEGTKQSDPFSGRDGAMAASSSLMNLLEGSLLGTRDQLYFSEYTNARFSHYDPAFVKQMLQGGEAPLNIDKQETEYILYGLNNPSANIAAAYSEIFALRLAIRTMEGLITCRSTGHPLLVLAAALVYGIRNALLDLRSLVDKGTIQLSKYIKVDTNYADYLRLFMLSHGGSANALARTIAIMEHASGVSFDGAYTYSSGEGTASVKLWFFPGLLKVMGRYGDLGGTVKGSRYEATYTADSSYQ